MYLNEEVLELIGIDFIKKILWVPLIVTIVMSLIALAIMGTEIVETIIWTAGSCLVLAGLIWLHLRFDKRFSPPVE